MIRPRYALMLARTKLRSKRTLLAASVIVSSLLFATLIAGIIVFTGAEKSAVTFVQKANNNQYLVQVNPVIPTDEIQFSQDLSLKDIQDIKAFEKTYYDTLRAKYKALNIPYNSTAEVPALTPAAWKSKSLPEELRVQISFDSPVIQELIKIKEENYAKTAKNKLSDLKAIGAKYDATGYYVSRNSGLPDIPAQHVILNNKENFEDSELKGGNLSITGYFVNAVHNGMYSFEDKQLLGRYLLDASKSQLKGIPVIISAQEAVSLFGKQYNLKTEPENEQRKAAWLGDVQKKMNGYTYQSCYRNSTETSMLNKIQQDYSEIVTNKNNKDYKKPSLIYDYPTEPCGDIKIAEDTRTITERKAEQTSIDNQKRLGTYLAPFHKLLTFQIVGIMNAQPYTEITDIKSYIKSLVTTENRTSSAIIPRQLYDTLPTELKFNDIPLASNISTEIFTSEEFTTHILAFTTIDQAQAFMNQETCPGSKLDCKKLFTADPYGSNYLILNEIGKLFKQIMIYALPAVLLLAAIIIWFTMARVMAENRKETAVYRAMGAKRSDIVAIYLIYSVIIAIRIAFFAALLGVFAAFIINSLYSETLTSVAIVSFGNSVSNLSFSLFNLSSPFLLLIIIIIVAVVLVAVIQPLIRNVVRSPINDMRDE